MRSVENRSLNNNRETNQCLVSQLAEKIKRYTRVPHYVLITGERGTGKTTVARQIHEQSARAKKEFVNLNCASLSENLLEAELFGYEKGAFTGAAAPKAGLFEVAGGGTLFLDEIGELSTHLQAKLLKAVEEQRIRRVGSNMERQVDVRIIAATSQNLKEMIADGRFRADLYDRLNVLNLETVPLRHQKEKIRELIVKQLQAELPTINRLEPFVMSEEAFAELENHDWHGNFRELLNFATRLAIECLDDKVIAASTVRKVLRERSHHLVLVKSSAPHNTENVNAKSDVRFDSSKELVTVTFNPKDDDLDSIYIIAAGTMIQHVLQQHDGNLRRAASGLNTTHTTLIRLLKKFDEKQQAQNSQTSELTRTSFAVAA